MQEAVTTAIDRALYGPPGLARPRHLEEERDEVMRLPWRHLRTVLGQRRARAAILQLFCAATSYRPLEHQMRFHLADAANKFLCGGVGAGKSYASTGEASMLSIANPGVGGVMASPTYDQVLHVLLPLWRQWMDELAAAGYPLQRYFSSTYSRADLVCGGSVYFRSYAKVDNLSGFTLGWGGLDESELHPNPLHAWDIVSARLRDPKANITEMFDTSTPRGMQGLVEEFHKQRQTDRRRDYYVVICRSYDNPHLRDEFFRRLGGYSKKRYAQDVEAKILKADNLIYPEWDRARHLVRWTPPAPGDPTFEYDLITDAGDQWPYVGWVQRLPHGWVLFDELAEDGLPYERVQQIVEERCRKLGKAPANATYDRAVKRWGAWLINAFSAQGTRVFRCETRQEQSVQEGLEAVRALLDPMPDASGNDNPLLYVASHLARGADEGRGAVKSFERYRHRQYPDGRFSSEPFKDNVHDHAMDAIRMWAVKVAKGQGATVRNIRRQGNDWSDRSRRRGRY